MEPMVRTYILDEAGERFFGEGPYRLLCGIEQLGSLRASATSMGMAYTKALRLIRHAEEAAGFPFTQKSVGGAHGGGSILTTEGKEFVRKYEEYRARCIECNRRIFDEIFCVERAATSDPDGGTGER